MGDYTVPSKRRGYVVLTPHCSGMSQVDLLERCAMPHMLVIVSAATTENADIRVLLVDGMDPVLAPMAPSRKSQHVALAGCPWFVRV